MHPPYHNLFDVLFTGLSVRILGESHVEWQETRSHGTGKNSRTETVTYSNHERYFKEKVIVYGFGKISSLRHFFFRQDNHFNKIKSEIPRERKRIFTYNYLLKIIFA